MGVSCKTHLAHPGEKDKFHSATFLIAVRQAQEYEINLWMRGGKVGKNMSISIKVSNEVHLKRRFSSEKIKSLEQQLKKNFARVLKLT